MVFARAVARFLFSRNSLGTAGVRVVTGSVATPLIQSDFFSFPVERGLVNPQNLGRFGEVGGSF
jgi:hypothetical protein